MGNRAPISFEENRQYDLDFLCKHDMPKRVQDIGQIICLHWALKIATAEKHQCCGVQRSRDRRSVSLQKYPAENSDYPGRC